MMNIETILLIENDDLWSKKVLNLLNYYNYHDPVICKNIQDTRTFLEKNIPDLIITDIYLGNETVFSAFNEKSREIPILFITNSEDKMLYHEANKFPFSNYLVKSFHPINFDAALNILMKYYRQIRGDLAYNNGNVLKLKNRLGRLYMINIDDIIYVQVKGNYSMIKTKDDFFMKKISMHKLHKLLGKSFIRVSKSIMVHNKYIKEATVYPVKYELKTPVKMIKIGRIYRSMIEKFLNQKRIEETSSSV